MLQYSLLFLEFVLLGAMAYLYFTTRKTVEDSAGATLTPATQPGWVKGQITATQMAQEMTQLMEELQAVTSSTRADMLKQRDTLQELLDQTEAAAGDLRRLLEQSGQQPASPKPAAEFKPWQPPVAPAAEAPSPAPKPEPAPAPEPEPESLVPLELIYSPSQFGEYLQISGCGPEVVSLATEHAQEFVIWFTAQFDDDEAPPRLIDRSYLEQYQRYMEDQRQSIDTIKRRLIALQAYINWANNISQLGEEPALPQPEPEADTSQHQAVAMLRSSAPAEPSAPPEKAAAPKEQDRYHTVLALAEQGFDQLAIAARTGMEQEAVRMIMMLKRSAVAG
ncbi:MAG: hypothetical protein Kow0031_41820 [Anaerolineae bacterium]